MIETYTNNTLLNVKDESLLARIRSETRRQKKREKLKETYHTHLRIASYVCMISG